MTAGYIIAALVGAIIFLTGYLTHAATGHRPPQPTTPTCGCGHSLAAHDRSNDRCSAAVRREHYMKSGARNGWEWVSCACVRYVGPEHLADVWAPDVIGGPT